MDKKNMNQDIDNSLIIQFCDFVTNKLGLYFPENRYRDLTRGIISTAKDLRFSSPQECIKWFISGSPSKEHLDSLASNLTIGETYFFRDKKVFKLLKEKILKNLIQERMIQKKQIRIWSAACSTGEEAYSIAMVIHELIPSRIGWNILILASDINTNSLEKARIGSYTHWSFRDTPESIKEQYFTQKGKNEFLINSHIKNMVTFSQINFAESPYPSPLTQTNDMDIIFCRNVLMYFSSDFRDKVVNKLYQCLVNNGWLIVSPGEAEHAKYAGLKSVRFTGATLYQKQLSEKDELNSSFTKKLILTQKDPIPLISPSMPLDQPLTESKSYPSPPSPPLTTTLPSQKSDSQTDDNIDVYQLINNDQLQAASNILLKKLANNKPDGKEMALLAKAYANQRNLGNAKQWCEKAIQADQFNAKHYYLLSTICQEQDDLDAAIKALKRTLYLDPDFIMAYFALGNVFRRIGKTADAKKNFKNAINLLNNVNPNDSVPNSEGMTAGRLIEIIKLANR